eukprot:8486928-Prorocentrum_lima.AAC.1
MEPASEGSGKDSTGEVRQTRHQPRERRCQDKYNGRIGKHALYGPPRGCQRAGNGGRFFRRG